MTTPKNRLKPLRKTVLTAAAFLLVGLPAARAEILAWADPKINTPYVNIGLGFAGDALRAERATDLKTTPDEVAGHIGQNLVVIHCIGTTPKVTAMVMIVGPDKAEADKVRDAVRDRISKIVNFD